jgi:hypothetical protein
LRTAWGAEEAEDVWSIGQIGAIFAWAPLLVEMCYSALEPTLQRRQQGEFTSSGTNIAMQDLERGSLQVSDRDSDDSASITSESSSSEERQQLKSANPFPAVEVPSGRGLTTVKPSSLRRRNTK